jgi:hypothetical protein
MYLLKRIKNSLTSRFKTAKIKLRARRKKMRSNCIDLGKPKAVIWIFGCQRSGTTFLENIFRHDLDSIVFGEFSELTIDGRKTVLTSTDKLVSIVSNKNAKYAVIRPLFESDRAIELMNLFPNSIGIWMFRDCLSVINSMKRKWDEDFFNISKLVESDHQDNWRLEKKLAPLNNFIGKVPIDELYAQYWIIRNSIPIEKKLTNDSRIFFLNYETLVHNPKHAISKILGSTKKISLWDDFKSNVRPSNSTKNSPKNIEKPTILKANNLLNKLVNISNNHFQQ